MKIARVGDVCTHGAVIITGDETHWVDDRKVARISDLVNCPIHGINQIITVGEGSVEYSDQKTAHIGSVTQCGAKVITGSETMKIDHQNQT